MVARRPETISHDASTANHHAFIALVDGEPHDCSRMDEKTSIRWQRMNTSKPKRVINTR